MNGVRGNTTDLFFNCSICRDEDGYLGQFGGRSLVNTSCPASEVFHLECITGWLDEQEERSLDQRVCVCREPALPLIRMDGLRVLDDESTYCETRIFNACRTGNLRELRMLLRENETLTNRTYHSVLTGHPEHLLAVAIKKDHTDLVRFLIGCGADVNAAEHDGESPLHIAARLHRNEDFNMLIRAGADINNVLRTAVQEGNAEILEYLISTQPSQLALNNALREAAQQGPTQFLELLIAAGANDLNGALYIAVLTENIEARVVLVQHGANITTLLHSAAKTDDWEFFNHLNDPTHINDADEKGQTPLHIIAANGYIRCLEKLRENWEVHVNARNKNSETALHLAAYYGHVECLKHLFYMGAKVNATNKNNETALHLAVNKGHVECLKLLYKMEAEVNATNKNGETALHMAVYNGHVECLKLLYRMGAKVNATNKNGETALHVATKISIGEARQTLTAGKNINTPLFGSNTYSWFTSTTKHFFTAAHYTVKKENGVGCLKELINTSGVNINVTDNSGVTPLMIAAFWGKLEYLTLLLDAGADVNATAWMFNDTTQKLGWTALHFATYNASAEVIKALQNIPGIKVNEKDCFNGTALHYAARTGSAESIKTLLDFPDIRTCEYDNFDRSAIHYAAAAGCVESIKMLVNHIEDSHQDFCGFLALHHAARSGSAESVKALLPFTDVNKKTHSPWRFGVELNKYLNPMNMRMILDFSREHLRHPGWTPLHFAALSGSAETVKALLAVPGIMINEQAYEGLTALSVATDHGHTACEKLLVENGAMNNQSLCLIQ